MTIKKLLDISDLSRTDFDTILNNSKTMNPCLVSANKF